MHQKVSMVLFFSTGAARHLSLEFWNALYSICLEAVALSLGILPTKIGLRVGHCLPVSSNK